MDVVRDNFYEGWWRRGGTEVAERGNSAVRRPVVDLLSTGRQVIRGRSEGIGGERKGERKSRDFGAEVSLSK